MRVVKLYCLYFLVIAAVAGIAGALWQPPVAAAIRAAPSGSVRAPTCLERVEKLERELVIIEIYCATVEASCRGEPISDWSLPVSSL